MYSIIETIVSYLDILDYIADETPVALRCKACLSILLDVSSGTVTVVSMLHTYNNYTNVSLPCI